MVTFLLLPKRVHYLALQNKMGMEKGGEKSFGQSVVVVAPPALRELACCFVSDCAHFNKSTNWIGSKLSPQALADCVDLPSFERCTLAYASFSIFLKSFAGFFIFIFYLFLFFIFCQRETHLVEFGSWQKNRPRRWPKNETKQEKQKQEVKLIWWRWCGVGL